MRTHRSTVMGLFAVFGFVSAQPLLGQASLRSGLDSVSEVRLASCTAGHCVLISPIGVSVQEPVSKKSPLLAGALSFFLLPGVGSYYAGNSVHGTRHLLIAGGAAALMIAGAQLWGTELLEDCLGGDCDSSNNGWNALITVGTAAYVMNMVWATTTAMADANHHNRTIATDIASARLIGDVYIEPTFRLSSAARSRTGNHSRPDPRLGIQFVRRF